jgi:hypothetical protein
VRERNNESGVVTKIEPIKTEHKWSAMSSVAEKSDHLDPAPVSGMRHGLGCGLHCVACQTSGRV